MSKRRHKHVVNLSEIESNTMQKGNRFALKQKVLGRAASARAIGCSWYEQEPGKTAFPRHYHSANEESIFVLSGTGVVRIGEDSVEIGAGDYISFPVGPEFAHSVTANGSAPLQYLCFSTKQSVEVVGYPDSNKVGIFAAPAGSSVGDGHWQRALFNTGSAVDYYDGEDTEQQD